MMVSTEPRVDIQAGLVLFFQLQQGFSQLLTRALINGKPAHSTSSKPCNKEPVRLAAKAAGAHLDMHCVRTFLSKP